MDVTTALLNGKLTQEVYLTQSSRFVVRGLKSHVCKLHRSLYVLLQSPREWNERIDNYLSEVGLTTSVTDPSLYVFPDLVSLLVIYVDDVMLTGNHTAKI